MAVLPANIETYRKMGRVIGGVWDYYRSGDVSAEARHALLSLHCTTNGLFTDQLASLLRRIRPARPKKDVRGLLGSLSVQQQTEIAASIARDGYYKFEQLLDPRLCDNLEAYAKITPCKVEGRGQAPADRELFNPEHPTSKTYRLIEGDLVKNHAVHQIMGDPTFLAIAEGYLKTLPILSMVNLWWSGTFGNTPGADAAQEFHFDFDPPPIWLLFFIYLTDVGPDNGPHVYARGSHMAGHPTAGPLLQRGYVRIPDEDVAKAFGQDNIVELYGKRGTILAVDTRGFHKGKMLTAGHRLMCQLTYSCPHYSGAHGRQTKLPPDIHPDLAAAIKENPKVYIKYT